MDARTRKALIERLNRDAELIASHFGLRYASIKAERANVRNRYGLCDSDGHIRIRLRHVVTGKPLKYSSLVNTLCHELAHLRYFHHRPSFHLYYRRLLEYARAEGIYRPSPPRAPTMAPPRRTERRPRQLLLFSESS